MSPFKIVVLFCVIALFSQCRVTKYLEEDEVLLVKNDIKTESKTKADEEALYGIIKQKPNNKLFFMFRFNAWLYNRYDDETLIKFRDKKQKRIDKRNVRRQEKNKDLIVKSNETWRDRMVQNLGEESAIYDSLKTEISKEQLEIYLKKNGYFYAKVNHELKHRTRKKVRSIYTIDPGELHYVDSISWNVKDTSISKMLHMLVRVIEVSPGDQFKVQVLDDDREQMAELLNNSGYFDFSKEYISFKVDTLSRNNRGHIEIEIANKLKESEINPDSLVPEWHKKYKIGRVNFRLDFNPLSAEYTPTERILIGNHTFEYQDELALDPELLIQNVALIQGDLYQLKNQEATYKRLRNLGVFTYINIKYTEVGEENGIYKLNVEISLNTGKSQGVSMELTGTHRDGIWGANLKSGYRHNNVWRNAENLELNLSLGAEAQRSITAVENETSGGITENLRLNTLLIGPEVNLNLHKLALINRFFPKISAPLTTISGIFNYQIRPDFERTLGELSLTWKFHENYKNTIYLSLFDASIIDITKSQAFQDRLEEINDQFLLNSYQDHIILSMLKGSWEFNNQTPQFQKRNLYNRLGYEGAGYQLGNMVQLFNGQLDEDGFYTVDRIRYAQYFKLEDDLRFYNHFSKNHSVATRVEAGVGIPYGNSFVLPFEKSFFAGGANGLRAWQARSLGPGSFRDSSAVTTFNNLGEVKLNFSTEYRFDLTNLLEGALFLDAGNIWLLDDEDNKTGSEISSRFYEDIAVGAGFGFRLDFEYFLVRFDLGFKLKDPTLISGERWFWEPKTEYNQFLSELESQGVTTQTSYSFFPNLNLGIGYPF